jgi:hypothetical protein
VQPQPVFAGDEPWAAQVVRRTRRRGVLWLVAGLALFIGCGTAANYIAGSSDRLRSDGGQVTGRIEALQGFHRFQDSTADVVYVVAGRQYREEVALGNKVRNYTPGQSVTVYYDYAHPSTMTINDTNNEPAWSVLPMAIAFIGGLTLMIGGGVKLTGAHRQRRILHTSAWRDGVTVVDRRGAGTGGAGAYLRDGEELLRTGYLSDSVLGDATRIRVAGTGERRLLAFGDEPTVFVRARLARSAEEQRHWQQELTTASTPGTNSAGRSS